MANPVDIIEALVKEWESLDKDSIEYERFISHNWDKLAAAHYWLYEHHGGQFSREYALACRIHYTPGAMENGPDDMQLEYYREWCIMAKCKHEERE